jgi:uncharacterized protein with PIN domain
MNQAYFRFFAELNDFLPEERRQVDFLHAFEGHPSVKHLIEALGIPHTEVAHILVNEASQGFGYLVQDLDRVEVFPAQAFPSTSLPSGSLRGGPSAPLKTGSERPVQEPLSGGLRFILDNHLGRLAIYLRMLSFDALYRNDYQDEELALIAGQEKRILLTRDIRLLMRSAVVYGYWVRSKSPREQLVEVVRRYNLSTTFIPFRRCLRCNSLLEPVEKAVILHRLEPLTRQYYDVFHLCPACDRIYWRGSHYERMQQLIESVRGSGSIDR